MGASEQGKEFDRIELAAKLFAPPPIKFSDLDAALDAFSSSHKLLTGPPFPFDVRTDFVKVTDSMDLVPITIQIRNRDITFVTKDGVSKGVVNILGKVTTIMHKTVQTFEDTVEVEEPSELLEKSLDRKSLYWKALPLQPGLYRLDIAIKDVNNPDHIGIYGRGARRSDLRGRQARGLVADPGRRDEHGLLAADRQRQLHHQQHIYPAARGIEPGHAGELQTQPGPEFLDAVL